jgi:branched-chain amino acid transport system ATP-binding protein
MSGSLLELSSVSLSFGGLRAVNNVSFTVEPRQITSLIGPNGAGKTTVFNIISGFLRAQEGKILFLGQEIQDRKPHQIARLGIGRTF